MKAFYSESHTLHTPTQYIADGQLRPCHEIPVRVDRILAGLKSAGAQLLTTSPTADLAPIARIHDPAYLHYLQHIHAEWFAEFSCDVLPDTFPRRAQTTRPTKLAAQAGWYCFDMAAPITAGTWQAALAAAHAAVSAANSIIHGERAAYALCRPPGHHAGPDYCGGFCYLNNAAIAAEHLRAAGMNRVAILDVDYHHGNGTQDIFYHRSDVLVVSIHADPNTQYPYFWGHANETGAGPGEGFNFNLPLPRGASSDQWFQALEAALARIRAFAPQALVISLGVDAHEADGVGDFQLQTKDFTRIGQRIASLQLPTVFVQEGGYNLDKIGDCVGQTLCGFESRP